MKELSFYIHIPFCVSKCIYCGFVSFINKQNCFEFYTKRLQEEILTYKQILKDYKLKSIFFGGGTPSILPSECICQILSTIKQNFNLTKTCEITLEANPESFDEQKAFAYKNAGINRLSFGLQSCNNKVLKFLGRPHTKKDFENAILWAKNAGFKNINADILIGTPNQTTQNLKNAINFLANQGVCHISAYGLMVEESTQLFKMVNSKQVVLPNEDQSVKLYETAVQELKKHGYNRYEISNFAIKGFECKHNQNYWARGEFLGFGVAAYSFFGGEHYENTKSLDDYLNLPFQKQNVEKETPLTAQNETIMLALRTENGLNLKDFNKKFNTDFEKQFEKELKELQQSGLISIQNGYLKITNFQVSNYIIEKFFV